MIRLLFINLLILIGSCVWIEVDSQRTVQLVSQIKTDVRLTKVETDIKELKQTDADILKMIRGAENQSGLQFAFSPVKPNHFFTLDSGQSGKCATVEGLIRDGEGIKKNSKGQHVPYLDTSKKCKHVRRSGQCLTVGVGFCMDCGFCKNIGCEWDGKPISDSTTSNWFARYIQKSEREIKTVVPCFDSLPNHVQAVVVDIWYTTGTGSLGSFKNTIKDLCKGFYDRAASRIGKSKWCIDDVKKWRCGRNVHILKTGEMICKKDLKNE